MKRHVRTDALLLVCLLLLTLSALAPPASTAGTVIVRGAVTDNSIVTHPLPNAIVTVAMSPTSHPYGNWVVGTAITDANGRYSVTLSHSKNGPYKGYIKAKHTNYWAMVSWPINAWNAGHTYSFGLPLTPNSGHPSKRWGGLRNSYYGATNPDLPESPDTFPYPTNDEWGEATREMAGYFGTSATLLLVVGEVVTENPTDGGIRFWFPKPSGVPEYPRIAYEEKPGLDIEQLLSYCDNNGIGVFLQVEPGHAAVTTLLKIVMDEFGLHRHRSVQGFVVDVEWYGNSKEGQDGVRVTNAQAKSWEQKVKAYSPTLQLGLKHYGKPGTEFDKMPPSFKGDVIFINDSQEYSNLSGLVSDMRGWANYFAPNDVIFQQGYAADYGWWQDLTAPIPKTYGNALFAAGNPAQVVGFLWVDFTMRMITDAFD